MVLVCLVLFVGSLQAWALEGRLEHPDGTPISGARITIAGKGGTIVAQADGSFALDPEPAVPFVMYVARSDGVAMRPVTVDEVPSTGVLVIRVEPISETLTVISGVIPDLEVPPAVATSVISRADLTQRHPSTLADVLEIIPGTTRTGAGHGTVPGLRGLPKHRTLVLLDEGRVSAERRAGVSMTFLDPDTVEEVEVVRGPGCVAYGSDAFGGVIRARSRMPAIDGPATLHFNLSAGAGIQQFGGSAEFATRLLGGGFLAGVQARRFDEYRSPEGTVEDSGAESRGFRFAYQKLLSSGILRMGWRTDQSLDVGKPTPPGDGHHRVYPKEDSHRFHLGFEKPGSGRWTRITAGLAWDAYGLDLDKRDEDGNGVTREIAGSQVDARDYEFRLEAEGSLGASRLVLGINGYGRYDVDAINRYRSFDAQGNATSQRVDRSIEEARRDDVGAFFAVERDFDALRLSAGGRFDTIASKNTGGFFGSVSTRHDDWSGFLALRYQNRGGWVFTAQVARGFRDALISDRYYRGETGRGFITGNPDLTPENSLQFDSSVRGKLGKMELAAYAYVYRISDLIERYRDDGDYFFRNRDQARIQGIELEGELPIGSRSALQFNASWQRGKTRPDNAPTDDIAPPGCSLTWRTEPSQSWFLFARAAAFSKDDRPGPNEQVVPGYAVIDAGAGIKVNHILKVQLSGKNLLDRAHLASADEDSVLAPGRSIHLSLKSRF